MAKKAVRPAGKATPKPAAPKRPARPGNKSTPAPAAPPAAAPRLGTGSAQARQAATGPAGRPGSAHTRGARQAAPAGTGNLKVRATAMGYYDNIRRRPGDVFVLKAADRRQFSARWMEPVDPETPEQVTTGKAAIEKQHDELLGKMVNDKNAGGTGSAAAAAGTTGVRSDAENPIG